VGAGLAIPPQHGKAASDGGFQDHFSTGPTGGTLLRNAKSEPRSHHNLDNTTVEVYSSTVIAPRD
jgi:hypothetical protein